MASFKLAKKDALSDTRTNIYFLHEKRLNEFDQEKEKLNFYLEELDNLKKNVKKCDKNTLKDLENKIYDIKNDTGLNNYLLDFVSIINEPDISYFEENSQKGQMDSFINSKINNSKTELYNTYIEKFNPELKPLVLFKNVCFNTCTFCGCESLLSDTKLSVEVCSRCGNTNHILNSDVDPVYSSNIEKETIFNYKRNNHFQECLNQLQAKENTTIPTKIIDDLTTEFKKYNITDPKVVTTSLLKNILKKLKYNKYYEHIPTIINQFCGIRAPKMTPELEQQLKLMFDEIQTPFEKYSFNVCPDRKNFLNYNYVFYKMCELLNKDEFLCYFPLLKSREKLYEHDLIWKGICQDLRWEYIPSI